MLKIKKMLFLILCLCNFSYSELFYKRCVTFTGDLSNAMYGYQGFGHIVKDIGDINNDGFGDIAIAINSDECTGYVYLFFGSNSLRGELNALDADVCIIGETRGGDFGCSLSSLGDINSDGIDDFIIGGQEEAKGGRAYIFFGQKSFSKNINADQADIIIDREDFWDLFGESVSSAGDFNNDGIKDILICALQAGKYDAGCAYLFYGKKSFPKNISASEADIIFYNNNYYSERFGYVGTNVGDFNNDGIDDIAIGSSGKAYIFLGNSSNPNKISVREADITIVGDDNNQYYGGAIYGPGDFNGDNINDIIIGSELQNVVNIFFGRQIIKSILKSNEADVTIGGGNISNNIFPSFAGDLNYDGYTDIIIGEPKPLPTYKGNLYFFYGSPSLHGQVAYNQSNFILTGDIQNDRFGCSISSSKNVFGIGTSGFIVGADMAGAIIKYVQQKKYMQGYAYLYQLYGINLYNPNIDDLFVGGNTIKIEWDIIGVSFLDHIILEYSIDGGLSYPNIISDNVHNSNYYIWVSPFINSNKVKIKIKAMDINNNLLEYGESDGAFTIDSTAPNDFQLISPISEEYVNDRPILIWEKCNDIESGIFKYDIYLNDSLLTTVDADIDRYQLNYSLAEGSYTWSVVAFNNLMMQTKSSIVGNFKVETKKPFLNLMSPIENGKYAGHIDIIFAVSDSESGISNSSLYCDGQKIISFGDKSDINWQWDVNEIIEGKHVIEIITYDKSGNYTNFSVNISTSIFYETSGEIENGGFELNNFTGWEIGTTWDVYGYAEPTDGKLPVLISSKSHSGSHCAFIGGLPLVPSGSGPFCSWIRTSIQMPTNLVDAKLEYAIWPYSDNSTGVQKGFYLIEGSTTKYSIFDYKANDAEIWLTNSIKLPANQIKSKVVTFHFEVVVMAGGQNTLMLLDDVKTRVTLVTNIAEGNDHNPLPFIKLEPNHPNPFNNTTVIKFYLPQSERVSITIYNISGQIIRTLTDSLHNPGEYSIVWDGKDNFGIEVPSGIFMYRLLVDGKQQLSKMTLLR